MVPIVAALLGLAGVDVESYADTGKPLILSAPKQRNVLALAMLVVISTKITATWSEI
ncbi:MAG: hypothetical protein AAF827_01460 [Cyanobacteria bacterium P01_D01_bin.6]